MIIDKIGALAQRYRRMRFQRAVRDINKAAPLRLSPSAKATLLSMVQHRDVNAYLLAAKTFARRIIPRRVIIVADPSLTPDDRRTIEAGINGVEFIEALSLRQPGLPSGGCWERLIAIAQEAQQDYVVQLDADTVTLGRLDEVALAIESDRAFLLASEPHLAISELGTATAWAKHRAGQISHIQIQAEANLDALGGTSWRYVRACAAFAGFPARSFGIESLREVTSAMNGRLGNRWNEWGTEQVTSNLVCASQPGAVLLPNPKYCNADLEAPDTEFLHFIGYARFTTSRYADLARAMCQEMAETRASR